MAELIRDGVEAFARGLIDYHNTGEETLLTIFRVDDGNIEEMPASPYFDKFGEWPTVDRALTHWIEGRTLDIGLAAGRLCLYLQDRGQDVVGIDLEPAMVQLAQDRGVKDARVHDILAGPVEGEKFDSICLFGHNLGIAGKHDNVKPFIEMLTGMLEPGGRIIGTQVNWAMTTKKEHLDFQQSNRDAGRHPVEMTLKIEYDGMEESFSWCLTDQDEIREIADEIGMQVEAIIDCGGVYGYVLKMPGE